MEHIKKLLSEVNNILAIEKQEQEAKQKRGENFNVFRSLGLWSEEVRLHSRFIATLLNPRGNHGLYDAPLNAFIEVLELSEFDTSNAIIEVEKHIGMITPNHMSGGNIDIIISNQNRAIVIENKIYAGDQPKQLFRYDSYCKDCYKAKGGYDLLYLTLNGKSASEESLYTLGEDDYMRISYSSHIISWLERCLELSKNHSLVRETTKQYLNLIKQLTHQNMDNIKKKELIELFAKAENYDSVVAITELRGAVINNIFRSHFVNNLQAYLSRTMDCEISTRESDCSQYGVSKIKNYDEKYFQIWIKPSNWKHCAIGLQFNSKYRKALNYGIRCYDGQLEGNLKLEGFHSTGFWLVQQSLQNKYYYNWDMHIHSLMFDKESKLYKDIGELILNLYIQTQELHM
ncbi:MAG: PD-(D/E)XK nuclease family protein [Rikenellaceae bacterium]